MKRVLELRLSRVFWLSLLIILLFPSNIVAQKGELFNAEGVFGSFPKKIKKQMDDLNRIIKGGSWSDPLVYQLIAAKTHLHEQKSSCRVGFRMVISYF